MKKFCLILSLALILIAIPFAAASALTKSGDYLYTDIVAEINGHPIRSYNVADHMAVVAEDLRPYGFYAIWNAEERTLKVLRAVRDQKPETPESWPEYEQPSLENVIGAPAGDVYETDIKTYIAGEEVSAFNINGETLIWFRDLAPLGIVNWNEAERKAELTLADPVYIAFAPVIEGVENWKQMAGGDGTRYEIYDAAGGKLLVYTYAGTPHGSSTAMLFVKHTGESLLINSLLPNTGWGNSYYMAPHDIKIDGADRMSFVSNIKEMGEDMEIIDRGDCLVEVDLHQLVLLSIQPLSEKLTSWSCSMITEGAADGPVLEVSFSRAESEIIGSVKQHPGAGITITADQYGLTLVHDMNFFTGGESDPSYIGVFDALKELGVPDAADDEASIPTGYDDEQLQEKIAERFSLTMNGEPVKGELQLSQGNGGRYIFMRFDEPLAFGDDELLLTVK